VRSIPVARLGAALAALAVAVALFGVERERGTCKTAQDRAYLNARAPATILRPAVDRVIADCAGSEPLMGLSLGLLQLGRRELAGTLARAAADREPASYLAWGVLSHTERGKAARAATAHAQALNPLAARAAGP
jgi:hypothetical protein